MPCVTPVRRTFQRRDARGVERMRPLPDVARLQCDVKIEGAPLTGAERETDGARRGA